MDKETLIVRRYGAIDGVPHYGVSDGAHPVSSQTGRTLAISTYTVGVPTLEDYVRTTGFKLSITLPAPTSRIVR